MPFSVLAGAILCCAGVLLLRRVAGTRGRNPLWWLIDAALPLIGFLLLIAFTARPLFSGIVSCMLCAGYAYADRAKRRVLAEPIVPTDVFQAFDIFRHPQLALPFPHKGRVAVSVIIALSIFAGLFYSEMPMAIWSPWWPALSCVALALVIWLLAWPLREPAGHWLRRAGLVADPLRDSAAFGPLATLLAYALLARAERAMLQARVSIDQATVAHTLQPQSNPGNGPLVVIQCESFFDARRLHPSLERSLRLPAIDRCRQTGVQWGRLAVPSWGANTVRTEFAMLTGLAPEAIGFDRFNPYHRFARMPIASLAWRMKARGYRTICLHPFDRRFYGRDQVMPNLGFDQFIGEEAFLGAQRINGYVADVELARAGREILRDHGGRVFLFVITMENHGPWNPLPAGTPGLLPNEIGLTPQLRSSLEAYLQSLRSADTMFGHFADSLADLASDGVLAMYGDHLPSFPAAFKYFGLEDSFSDYLVWRSGHSHHGNEQKTIAAERLSELISQARER